MNKQGIENETKYFLRKKNTKALNKIYIYNFMNIILKINNLNKFIIILYYKYIILPILKFILFLLLIQKKFHLKIKLMEVKYFKKIKTKNI